MLSIYKMIKMWCEYIDAVWRGEAAPKSEYIRLHVIDYAISIYYFLTDNTGENIIFWSKYTGCFPTSVPSSTFSDKLGDMISNPSYNISFAYSRKDDCNPIHLAEFNQMTLLLHQYIIVKLLELLVVLLVHLLLIQKMVVIPLN